MQTISGSVGLSLPANGTTGKSENSTENQVDMASGLGFLALFTTQVNSAFTTQINSATDDLKLPIELISEEAELQEINGKVIPQTLPLAAMLARHNIDPEKFLSEQDMDFDLNSGKVLSQLLSSGTDDGRIPSEKFSSNLGNELISVKALLEGIQQGQTEPDNLLAQILGQVTGNTSLRGQASQAVLPGYTAINSPLGQPGAQAWGNELVSRVKWQIGQEFQEATIQLNPRELGPLHVKININDDQATVQFVAQHAIVRDAIEDAMPRLREMLEQSGLNLADANVSQGSHRGQGDQQDSSEEASSEQSMDNDNTDELIADQTGSVVRSGDGLVDAFV